MAKKQSLFNFEALPTIVKHSYLTRLYMGVMDKRLSSIELDRYHLVLIAIADNDEALSQQDLADYYGSDKTYLIKIIDYLVSEGYVLREINPSDKRKYFLKLTDKAKKDLPTIRTGLKKVEEMAFKDFTKEEMKECQSMMDRVFHNLKDQPSEYYLMSLRKY